MSSLIAFITKIDKAVALFMNAHVTNLVLLRFFNIFSIIGTGAACWIAFYIIYSFYKKDPKIWLYWIVPFIACYLISELGIKHLVARPRPFIALDGITMLAARLKSYSFPSGHSALSASALLIAWKLRTPPNIYPYLAVAVLIASSRVILKAHFLSDVLGGICIGLLITWAAIKALDLFFAKRAKRREA